MLNQAIAEEIYAQTGVNVDCPIGHRGFVDGRNAKSSRTPQWADALPDGLYEVYITAFEHGWNTSVR